MVGGQTRHRTDVWFEMFRLWYHSSRSLVLLEIIPLGVTSSSEVSN